MRRALFLVFLLVPLLFAAATDAGVYKWTDESGKTHYTDSPPPGRKDQEVKLQEKSLSGPAVVSKTTAPGATSRPRIRLFSAVWCGYCKLAKTHLARRGIAFEELDVEQSATGRDEYRRLEGRGVPVILVGDQRMDGFDPAALDVMLKNAGY